MKNKLLPKIFLSIVCLFFTLNIYGKTRAQVVADGLSLITIPSWTATNNKHVFSTVTFTSHFSTGTTYSQWPYVFGGKETQQTTHDRIEAGTSPGGENVDKNTPFTTKWLYYNGFWPAQHLAGIDCSGFACRALGYTSNINYTNTTALANLSTKINSANIKKGDLLIDIGNHVQVVINSNPLEIVEAYGGNIGYARQAPGNASYGAYSPFPVFTDLSVSSYTAVTENRPKIKARIKSATTISESNIKIQIDDIAVTPTITSGENYYDLTYTPTEQ